MSQIDYKELLLKYMKLVQEQEGTNFTWYVNSPFSSIEFSAIEEGTLENIEDKILNT